VAVTSLGAVLTRFDPPATVRVAVCFTIGVAAAVATIAAGEPELAPLAGWDGAGAAFLIWMWPTIWVLDARQTARRAEREDPGKVIADALLLGASVTSLAAVGVVLVKAANSGALARDLLVALAAVSVVIAWVVVHTVFTLRYALMYYLGEDGGIDFNESDPPQYTDFAYLSFTVGMTFQVSDTDIQDKKIRATILRHMWLSYVFGAVIVAITINLIAGLTTK
jgi:uncharacterized membrane protein